MPVPVLSCLLLLLGQDAILTHPTLPAPLAVIVTPSVDPSSSFDNPDFMQRLVGITAVGVGMLACSTAAQAMATGASKYSQNKMK